MTQTDKDFVLHLEELCPDDCGAVLRVAEVTSGITVLANDGEEVLSHAVLILMKNVYDPKSGVSIILSDERAVAVANAILLAVAESKGKQ